MMDMQYPVRQVEEASTFRKSFSWNLLLSLAEQQLRNLAENLGFFRKIDATAIPTKRKRIVINAKPENQSVVCIFPSSIWLQQDFVRGFVPQQINTS